MPTVHTVKNPCIIYRRSCLFYIQPFNLSWIQGFNQPWIMEYLLLKKSAHKGTSAVRTHDVQGPIVLSECLLEGGRDNIWANEWIFWSKFLLLINVSTTHLLSEIHFFKNQDISDKDLLAKWQKGFWGPGIKLTMEIIANIPDRIFRSGQVRAETY